MPKEKILKVKYPIYAHYNLYVIVTSDILASRAKKVKELNDVYHGEAPLGLFSYDEESFDSYMFLRGNADINTISHESFHFISRLFSRIGTSLSDESEEVYAYNLGHLIAKISKFVKKNKKKFKTDD